MYPNGHLFFVKWKRKIQKNKRYFHLKSCLKSHFVFKMKLQNDRPVPEIHSLF